MKARYGYMGKMLFVDLSSRKVHEEDLPEDLARKYIGGYGIGARIIMERMKVGADPLGPDNILGIGTGPLTLSGMVSTCRYTAMGKSPLTGYWGDANSGGNFANALKASGYDIVFFEGKGNHPVYLLITDGKVEIKDARHLWGRDTVKTEEIIRQENGDANLKIACIGPAGEKCSRIAAVINDGGRAAARSGLGAVMGSKNLKAIACGGSQRPDIFDKAKMESLVKEMLKETKTNPSGLYSVLTNYGTPGITVMTLQSHGAPIKNWGGNNIEDFPEKRWAALGWEGMEKYQTKKYACTGCPIACGGWMKIDSGKYAVQRGHKPEYETCCMFGSNCLIDNMESLIYANELCGLYGFDTISAGAVVAFAIECFENGILTRKDTDGLELTWGNADAMISLLEKMGKREGIGDLLADGVRIAATKIGRGAEQFAMHVGGQEVPAHDPREHPGFGAKYVSDPTPGRHTRGGMDLIHMMNPETMNLLGLTDKYDKYKLKDEGEGHAVLASWAHLMNTSGMCLFGFFGLNFHFVELMKATTGWKLTVEELIKTGHRISTLLHAFNLREGFKPGDFKVPPRLSGTPPFKVGILKDITIDFEVLKRSYYEAMGFDTETGVIQKERIEALGLQDILS